ncbi:putative ABC-type phosphate transporter [Helianthus debilis subsp. tardiflorus]
MIGGTFVRGVSGGERKRVCIGLEKIINPSLLFLDEPTSGLDSTTALKFNELLQDVAETEKTVITTIHQSSSRLFHKFDNLILLGKWSLLYFGKASEAMLDFYGGSQKFTVLKTSIIKVVILHCGILGIFPVFTAIFTFPQERAMLNKGRATYMYRLSAYFMARTTTDLPLDLFLPMLSLLVIYFMAGLRLTADSFFLTIFFLCIVAAQGPGLAIGATLTDLKKATTLASVTVMAFMVAGRYFVKDRFDPIADSTTSRLDLIPHMVYGRSLKQQDYGEMYCATLTVNSKIVCVGRIFGQDVAEIPLVATSSECQGLLSIDWSCSWFINSGKKCSWSCSWLREQFSYRNGFLDRGACISHHPSPSKHDL